MVCGDSDTSLLNCTLTEGMCSPNNAAGVRCSGPPGPCESSGHTSCCISGCSVNMPGAPLCYCDSVCHTFDDCCSDIVNTCPDC